MVKTRNNLKGGKCVLSKRTGNKKIVDNFLKNINSIYDGDFFERIPIEDEYNLLTNEYDSTELKKFNKQLIKIRNDYKKDCPSVISILKMKIPDNKKQELLEKIHLYSNAEILSFDYNKNLKFLKEYINNDEQDDTDLINLEEELSKSNNNYNTMNELKIKILKSEMTFENKRIAYNKFAILSSYNSETDSEYFKYKVWIDTLLQIPFNIYKTPSINLNDNKDIRDYLKSVRIKLDEKLSFLEKPKDQFINMISHNIKNPNSNFNAIGLHGVRGTGKTSLISSLSEAIDRPFKIVSLGGESDGSVLTGHSFTYIGSTPGRIINILKETQCMNCIILFDELDKVSNTPQGNEIIATLIHLTDTTTNKKYTHDKYFAGIEFDLSKIMFVFTYNDSSKINKILADRLYKIQITNYTDNEKLTIVKKHLLLSVLKEYYFNVNDIVFSDNVIKHIIQLSKQNGGEDGMRDVKNKLRTIISRINVLLMTNKSDDIIKLNYNILYEKYSKLPLNVEINDVDILLKNSDFTSEIVDQPPYGMYC